MYFHIECLKVFNIPCNLNHQICCIKANKDRSKICVLTKTALSFWLTASNQLVSFYIRSNESCNLYGQNFMIEFRYDSTKIALLTDKGYILIFKLISDTNVVSNFIFGEKFLDTTIKENHYQYPIVKLKIKHESTLEIQNVVKCIYNFNDELFVSLINGEIIKLNWNSLNEYPFVSIKQIPLKLELTDNAKSLNLDENICIVDFEFTNFMGGICVALVLSDGSAVYLVGESTDSADNTFQGLVAQVAGYEKLWYKHSCVAINPIYQLLTYGCKNGTSIAYYPDEVTLSLQFSNIYTLNQQNNINQNYYAIVNIKWTPDYRVLMSLYENGSMALFSVFGSLLFQCNNIPLSPERGISQNCVIKGMDFGQEGYSLWLYSESNEESKSSILGELKLIKSSLSNNPASASEHILLQTENRIKVCLNVNKLNSKYKEKSLNRVGEKLKNNQLGGHNIWQTIDVPLNYIATNYPIKFAAVDRDGKYLAVAGMYGFTHFSFLSRKWKLFGNATQEKDMTVTSGLLWWKDFICIGCFNFLEGRYEIRFYSRHTNLDNNYASSVKLTCNVLKMNVFEDILILLCSDCHIILFSLDKKQSDTKLYVNITKLIEFSIENYLSGNPFSVLSIGLSELRVEVGLNKMDAMSYMNSNSSMKYVESILLNVSGRLLMFQRDKNSPLIPAKNVKKMKSISFCPPVVLSSTVENIWTISNIECDNLYMKLSLWLCCGSNGMKVWLPLSHKEDLVRFQSHRIMLSFPLTVYPLAILINEALILGISNDFISYDNRSYYQVLKTTQIFMHSLLMQLLRKNLDFDALQIARNCKNLPHYAHILELLLHQILEQEANTSEPIPDPLLPRVVVFVREFSEYLQVVSHCTRKTDIALWPYLFIIVGDPSKLFEECLEKHYLDTAASYLIVLQNTERPQLCKQHASLLLETSLNNSDWKLSKDIIRFLTSIDPNDLENGHPISITATSPLMAFKKETFTTYMSNLKPQNNINSANNTKSSAVKSLSKKLSLEMKRASTESSPKLNLTINNSPIKNDHVESENTFLFDFNYIGKIIHDHGLSLLKKYKLKKLGYMFANLTDFSMLKWLKNEPLCGKIESYVEALLMIHTDFHWPLPIFAPKEFQNENKGEEMFHMLRTRKYSSLSDSTFESTDKNNAAKMNEAENADNEELFMKNAYLDLITQELANRGPSQSESQLKYLIKVFLDAECYEWVFLLALVLKNHALVNEVMQLYKSSNPPIHFSSNFLKGLNDLSAWAKTECLGYNSIMQNILNYIEQNQQNGHLFAQAQTILQLAEPKNIRKLKINSTS